MAIDFEQDPFASFAEWKANRPAPPEAVGLPTAMARGFKQAIYGTLPTMAGQAIKAVTPVGSDVYKLGEEAYQSGEAISRLPELQDPNYEQRGELGKLAVSGARGVGQMVPVIAAGLINPYLGAAAAGGLYGASTYQDTKEKMLKQEGLDDEYASLNPNDPRVLKAKQTALASGSIQGAGEAAMGFVGGKFLKGVPLLGQAGAKLYGTSALRRFGVDALGKSLAEGGTEVIQDEAQAAIERAAELQGTPAFGEQAAESFRGGFGTSALLSPLGIPAAVQQSRVAKQMEAMGRAPISQATNPYGQDEEAGAVAPETATPTMPIVDTQAPVMPVEAQTEVSATPSIPVTQSPVTEAVSPYGEEVQPAPEMAAELPPVLPTSPTAGMYNLPSTQSDVMAQGTAPTLRGIASELAPTVKKYAKAEAVTPDMMDWRGVAQSMDKMFSYTQGVSDGQNYTRSTFTDLLKETAPKFPSLIRREYNRRGTGFTEKPAYEQSDIKSTVMRLAAGTPFNKLGTKQQNIAQGLMEDMANIREIEQENTEAFRYANSLPVKLEERFPQYETEDPAAYSARLKEEAVKLYKQAQEETVPADLPSVTKPETVPASTANTQARVPSEFIALADRNDAEIREAMSNGVPIKSIQDRQRSNLQTANTKYFADNGIKTLRLYRGGAQESNNIGLPMTANKDVAQGYADRKGGKVVAYDVPVEDVIVHYQTDPFLNHTGEQEVFVVNKEYIPSPTERKTAPSEGQYRTLDDTGTVTDGKGIKPDEIFRTSSGRTTTPFPKQKGEKYVSRWTIDNAVAEAESRGDSWNANQFRNTTIRKGGFLTPADSASMNMYLFGEQPAVPRPFLKPLAPSEAVKFSTDETQKGDTNVLRQSGSQDLLRNVPDDVQKAIKEIEAEANSTSDGSRTRVVFEVLARVPSSELSKVAKIFGKQIILFRNTAVGSKQINAAVNTNNTNYIFINENSTNPHMAVLGHELFHAMSKDEPALSRKFFEAIRMEGLGFNQYRGYVYPGSTMQFAMEEFLANLSGNQFMKNEFWEKLAKKEPASFGRIVKYIVDFIANIKQTYYSMKVADRYINDLENVQDAAVSVFNEYAKKRGIKQIQQEGVIGADQNRQVAETTGLPPASIRGKSTQSRPGEVSRARAEIERTGETDAGSQTGVVQIKDSEQSGFREGTTDAQIKQAKRLASNPISLPRGRASVVANAITANFRRMVPVSFIGTEIQNAEDVAAISQVYRNPSYETLRYFFVKDGKVVYHTGVSSRLPGSTVTFPTKDGGGKGTDETWIQENLDKSGADSFWLMHNHPSGNPAASQEDYKFTAKIQAQFPDSFKGHVTINHNKYGVIQQDTGTTKVVEKIFDNKEDQLLKASVTHPLLGTKIDSPQDVVNIGYELQVKDAHFLVVSMRGNKVAGLLEVPVNMPKAKMAVALKVFSLQTGTQGMVAVIPDKVSANMDNVDLLRLNAWAGEAVQNGFLMDAINDKGSAISGVYKPNGKRYGKSVRGYQVAESIDKLTTPDMIKEKAEVQDDRAIFTAKVLNRASAESKGSLIYDAKAELKRMAGNGFNSKQKEGVILRKWAESKGLIIDPANFNSKWNTALNSKGERIAGNEHDVVFNANNTVTKRNRMPKEYHESYTELFDRIELFNFLFGKDVSITLKGFQMVNGILMPEFTQKYLGKDAARIEQTQKFLEASGFEPVGKKTSAYRIPGTDIIVTDVFGDNTRSVNGVAIPMDYVVFHGDRAKSWLKAQDKNEGQLNFDESEIDNMLGDVETSRFSRTNVSTVRDMLAGLTQPQLNAMSKGLMKDTTPEMQKYLAEVGGIVEYQPIITRAKDYLLNLAATWKQGVFDQYEPLRKLSDKAYMMARLTKGVDGALESLVTFGNLRLAGLSFDADAKGVGLIKVLKKLQGEQDRFFWWIAANRSDQLRKEGRERLFSEDATKNLMELNRGTMTDGKSREQVYREVFAEYKRINKHVLDIAEQAGVIDSESRKDWEQEFYVPFYRTKEDSEQGVNISKGLVRQEGIKRLKGGKDKLNQDLLHNVINNWAHLINASSKNRAAHTSLKEAESLGYATSRRDDGKLLTADNKPDVWVMGRVQRKIPKGAEWTETDKATGEVTSGVSDGTKIIEEHGKIYYNVSDPHILTALTSLDARHIGGPMVDVMRKFKHALTFGVTLSPMFRLRNLMRDSIASLAVSKLGGNVPANIKSGMELLSDKEGQNWASMLASGGLIRFGAMNDGNSSANIQRLVNSGVPRGTILDGGWEQLKKVFGKYQEAGDIAENINRAALYKQLKKDLYEKYVAGGMEDQKAKDLSNSEAAFAARDLLDFSKGGSYQSVRFLTSVVPFLNARLQGLYKLGQGAKDDPRKFATVAGSIALASIALAVMGMDDEDWDKREDFDKANYWWFKAGGTAFRIPKPFEVGLIGTLAENSFEKVFAPDKMTWERYGRMAGKMMTQTLEMNPVPQVFKPVLDVYANKDSFTGRPIEKMGMERLLKQYRYDNNTSEIARFLGMAGGVTHLSPVQIDSMIRGYLGWLGGMTATATDAMLRPVMGRAERPTPTLKQVTNSFIEDLPSGSSRYTTLFYDQSREIERAYNSYQQALKVGDKERAVTIKEDSAEYLAKQAKVSQLKKEITRINQVIERVTNNVTYSATEKRKRIDELRQRQDLISRKMQ